MSCMFFNVPSHTVVLELSIKVFKEAHTFALYLPLSNPTPGSDRGNAAHV